MFAGNVDAHDEPMKNSIFLAGVQRARGDIAGVKRRTLAGRSGVRSIRRHRAPRRYFHVCENSARRASGTICARHDETSRGIPYASRRATIPDKLSGSGEILQEATAEEQLPFHTSLRSRTRGARFVSPVIPAGKRNTLSRNQANRFASITPRGNLSCLRDSAATREASFRDDETERNGGRFRWNLARKVHREVTVSKNFVVRR